MNPVPPASREDTRITCGGENAGDALPELFRPVFSGESAKSRVSPGSCSREGNEMF